MSYAERTSVSSEQTRMEIERLLKKHGATGFAYGRDEDLRQAAIEFRLTGRRIRFLLPLPNPAEFERTPARRQVRSTREQQAAYEQAERARWRALYLCIKAKLEAAAAGIVTVEAEFLAHVVLPSNQTVGDWLEPQIATLYATRRMPALLPGLESPPEVLALPAGDGR